MYHLKGLVAEDVIEKANGQYRLTIKGLQFAGTLSLETGRTRQQPKILNAIICQNERGEYLFSRWNRQPNMGMVSFPHGMMHFGEPVGTMAERELAEKAGLCASLTYRGDVYVRGQLAGAPDRHMLVHLFEATDVRLDAEDQLRLDVSESFWAMLDTLRSEDYVPGFYEIAQLVAHAPAGIIFADLAIEIKVQQSN